MKQMQLKKKIPQILNAFHFICVHVALRSIAAYSSARPARCMLS